MYLTLVSGIFDKGRKTSLNMQVIVGVYDSNGQLLKVKYLIQKNLLFEFDEKKVERNINEITNLFFYCDFDNTILC